MALTSTAYAIEIGAFVADASVTSTSRTYNAGELVVVQYGNSNNSSGGTQAFAISNSGTAQTWVSIVSAAVSAPYDVKCLVAAWYCVMSTTQAMTITCSFDTASSDYGVIAVEAFAGQNTTTPVPAGNSFTGNLGTDVTQSITPTSTGSMLRMWALDWSATNSFGPAAGCTLIDTDHLATFFSQATIRPTTDPRTDAAAFTIGETDTAGVIAWLAFEVQAAPSGPPPTTTLGQFDPELRIEAWF